MGQVIYVDFKNKTIIKIVELTDTVSTEPMPDNFGTTWKNGTF